MGLHDRLVGGYNEKDYRKKHAVKVSKEHQDWIRGSDDPNRPVEQHVLLRKSPWVERAENKELPAKDMTNGNG